MVANFTQESLARYFVKSLLKVQAYHISNAPYTLSPSFSIKKTTQRDKVSHGTWFFPLSIQKSSMKLKVASCIINTSWSKAMPIVSTLAIYFLGYWQHWVLLKIRTLPNWKMKYDCKLTFPPELIFQNIKLSKMLSHYILMTIIKKTSNMCGKGEVI